MKGRPSIIKKHGLDREIIELDSMGYNGTDISRIIEDKHDIKLSRMTVIRFLETVRTDFENTVWKKKYPYKALSLIHI